MHQQLNTQLVKQAKMEAILTLIGMVLFLFLPLRSSAGGLPSLVSHASRQSYSASAQAAFPVANQAGDLLITTILTTNTNASLNVTDSNNNTYTLASSKISSGVLIGTFYAKNSVGGNNVVTATAAGSANTAIYISEFSGINIANPLDAVATNGGYGANPNVNITTTVSGDLIYAWSYLANSANGAGNGFSIINGNGNNNYSLDEYQVQSSAAALNANTINSNPSNGTWNIIAVAFKTAGGVVDTTPPSTPTGLSATAVSPSAINLSWSPSTDNVAVTGYQVFRNGQQIASSTSVAYSDTGLSPSTSYSYTITAFDAAGNVSGQSSSSSATTLTPDTTPPTVSIGSPAANSTLSGTVTISANATDNVAVASVQFQLDNSNLGSPITTTPYNYSWDTTAATNGSHTLTAIAKDPSNNVTTSTAVTVTVNNVILPPVISDVATSSVTSSGVTITWTTDQPSDSQVNYGLTAGYGSASSLIRSLVTSHSVTLSGLASSSSYHFQVLSRNNSGSLTQSGDYTFVTGAPSSYSIGWTDLPNTKLQSVCPPNGFGPEVSDGKPYNFSFFCHYVIDAWGDGIGDTNHNRMIIWGGGHNNYGGNEIYQLDLGTKTMTRLDDPSLPVFDNNSGCGAVTSGSYPYQSNPSANNNWAMPDGRPNSRHTQGQEVYIPTINKMFTNNGAPACGNGLHYGDTWLLDLANITNSGTSGWQQMDPTSGVKIFNGTASDGGGLVNWWAVNAYDPNSDSVISEINDELLSYNYHTNTYTILKPYGTIHLPVAANRTIDTKRHLMITWGSEWPFGGADANSNVYIKTISLVAPYTVTDITAQVMNPSSGCTPWIATPTLSNPTSYYPWFFPGMAYDSAIDRTVLWPNTGSTIYLFNPDTNTCTSQALSGTPPTQSDLIQGTGTTGRFQYYPSLDVFALVSDPTQDAYILKIDNSNINGAPDTAPPSTPTGLSATAVSSSQVNLSWTASTDNVGVSGYQIFRNGSQVATSTTVSYNDTSLSPSTGYSYTVTAFDAAGNISSQSTSSLATTLIPDTTPPVVSIANPAASSTVSGTVTISANATDNVAVASVQFQLDGNNLGSPITTAPYNYSWDTTAATNGNHTLIAVATDSSGNVATSTSVCVIVSNTGPTTTGLVGYWNFDQATGTIASDISGNGKNATLNQTTWITGKINSGLNFNGTNSNAITPAIPLPNTFSVSVWVNPTGSQKGFTRILETHYNGGLYLGTDSSGTKYKFIVNTGVGSTGSCGGAAYGCAQGGSVTSGWHLLTATYDGTTARLYVDGSQVATDTFSSPGSTNLPLYMAQYYAGSGYNWNGGMDEVRLYNRALTTSEISGIYSYTGGD